MFPRRGTTRQGRISYKVIYPRDECRYLQYLANRYSESPANLGTWICQQGEGIHHLPEMKPGSAKMLSEHLRLAPTGT